MAVLFRKITKVNIRNAEREVWSLIAVSYFSFHYAKNKPGVFAFIGEKQCQVHFDVVFIEEPHKQSPIFVWYKTCADGHGLRYSYEPV